MEFENKKNILGYTCIPILGVMFLKVSRNKNHHVSQINSITIKKIIKSLATSFNY
jgi:hypothetical protein